MTYVIAHSYTEDEAREHILRCGYSLHIRHGVIAGSQYPYIHARAIDWQSPRYRSYRALFLYLINDAYAHASQ